MLELRKITKIYEVGDLCQTALDSVSLNFRQSEFAAILGASGSGKTTLLNVCAGIFKADNGAVFIDGEDVFDNNQKRAFMFYLSDNIWFPPTASIKNAAKYYSDYFPFFDFKVFSSICELFGLSEKASIRSQYDAC